MFIHNSLTNKIVIFKNQFTYTYDLLFVIILKI